MKLSIIISTWNSIQHIKNCIGSILSLEIPSTEIIIVDSNSKDGTREYLASLEQVRFLYTNERLTWSEANQIGLDVSTGDWICLSNPDIIFNGLFKEMLEKCQSNGFLAAAPQLIYPNGKLQPPAKVITPELSLWGHTRIGQFVLKKLGKRPTWQYQYDRNGREPIPVPFPQGSLFMFQRRVLEMFNGHLWNRGYLNGVSDFDAFLNMKMKGVLIWLFPQHKIVHFGSYITRKNPHWIERDQARGLVLYFRYHPGMSNKLSSPLYSIIFGLEGMSATGLEIFGRIVKHGNPFFNPRWTAWQAGQRILGLIDGWKYRI